MTKVRETLQAIEGVNSVVIDFEAKTATVSTKGSLSKKTVSTALTLVGYGVSSFEAVAAAPKIYDLGLSGLRTASDAKVIHKALAKLDDVDKVVVNLKAKSAQVTMKTGKTLSQAQVAKALTKPYGVTSFKEHVEAAKVYSVILMGTKDDEASAKIIGNALRKIDGVDSVLVDLATKKATITMKASKKLDRKTVEKALPSPVTVKKFAEVEKAKRR
ncbi:MAG: heavy metal-associated domain-containing protein [Planctomycetota bacterium]